MTSVSEVDPDMAKAWSETRVWSSLVRVPLVEFGLNQARAWVSDADTEDDRIQQSIASANRLSSSYNSNRTKRVNVAHTKNGCIMRRSSVLEMTDMVYSLTQRRKSVYILSLLRALRIYTAHNSLMFTLDNCTGIPQHMRESCRDESECCGIPVEYATNVCRTPTEME